MATKKSSPRSRKKAKTTYSTLDKPSKPPKNAKRGDIYIIETKKGRKITMEARPTIQWVIKKNEPSAQKK